jgi:HK97 family phage prohead protease
MLTKQMNDIKRAWKDAGTIGSVPAKVYRAQVKAAQQDDDDDDDKVDYSRALEFNISTSKLDRHGDVVSAVGGMFDNWKANPVVLWNHIASELPIARGLAIRVDDGSRVVARAEFASADVNPLADAVLAMYQKGFLNAVSIGFDPVSWEWAAEKDETRSEYDINFQSWDLLEFSAVTIPANSEALLRAKASGIDVGELNRHYNQLFEEKGLIDSALHDALHRLTKSDNSPIYHLVKSAVSEALSVQKCNSCEARNNEESRPVRATGLKIIGKLP